MDMVDTEMKAARAAAEASSLLPPLSPTRPGALRDDGRQGLGRLLQRATVGKDWDKARCGTQEHFFSRTTVFPFSKQNLHTKPCWRQCRSFHAASGTEIREVVNKISDATNIKIVHDNNPWLGRVDAIGNNQIHWTGTAANAIETVTFDFSQRKPVFERLNSCSVLLRDPVQADLLRHTLQNDSRLRRVRVDVTDLFLRALNNPENLQSVSQLDHSTTMATVGEDWGKAHESGCGRRNKQETYCDKSVIPIACISIATTAGKGKRVGLLDVKGDRRCSAKTRLRPNPGKQKGDFLNELKRICSHISLEPTSYEDTRALLLRLASIADVLDNKRMVCVPGFDDVYNTEALISSCRGPTGKTPYFVDVIDKKGNCLPGLTHVNGTKPGPVVGYIAHRSKLPPTGHIATTAGKGKVVWLLDGQKRNSETKTAVCVSGIKNFPAEITTLLSAGDRRLLAWSTPTRPGQDCDDEASVLLLEDDESSIRVQISDDGPTDGGFIISRRGGPRWILRSQKKAVEEYTEYAVAATPAENFRTFGGTEAEKGKTVSIGEVHTGIDILIGDDHAHKQTFRPHGARDHPSEITTLLSHDRRLLVGAQVDCDPELAGRDQNPPLAWSASTRRGQDCDDAASDLEDDESSIRRQISDDGPELLEGGPEMDSPAIPTVATAKREKYEDHTGRGESVRELECQSLQQHL